MPLRSVLTFAHPFPDPEVVSWPRNGMRGIQTLRVKSEKESSVAGFRRHPYLQAFYYLRWPADRIN